jgi:parallel beta-helix repeat protein
MRYFRHDSPRSLQLTALLIAAVALLGLIPWRIVAQSPASQPAAAAGTILHVSTQPGSPYATIQSAIDAAPDNATIHIAAGTYEETLAIHRPLTLEGEGWDKTRITPHLATIDDITKFASDIQKLPTAKQEETYLNALKQLLHPGVTVDAPAHVEIRNLQLAADPGSHLSTSAGYPHSLLQFDHTHVTLTNCILVGSPGNILSINDGTTADIHRTLIAGAWNTGINIGARAGRTVHVILADCDIRNNFYAGIRIARGEQASIDRCRISGSAWHGIRYDDASPTITHSRIFNNARSGIYASGRTQATITNNLFTGNEMDGISCWFGNVDAISHNTFANNLREAISVLGDSHPVIDHNLFYANPSAIDCNRVSGAKPVSGTPKLGDNLFWKNDTIKRTQMKPDPDVGTALEMDPAFTNPNAGDFSLPATSPAAQKSLGDPSPLPLASPFPLQPQEQSIIPTGDSRDYQLWKAAP